MKNMQDKTPSRRRMEESKSNRTKPSRLYVRWCCRSRGILTKMNRFWQHITKPLGRAGLWVLKGGEGEGQKRNTSLQVFFIIHVKLSFLQGSRHLKLIKNIQWNAFKIPVKSVLVHSLMFQTQGEDSLKNH